MWLNKSDDNMLSFQNIWNRVRLGLPVTEVLNSKLQVLLGYDLTMFIVIICANTMYIFCLINFYLTGAVGIRRNFERLKLAIAELKELMVYSRTFGV